MENVVSEIRCPRCGQTFPSEYVITDSVRLLVSRVNDEGHQSTPEDQLQGHLKWCRRSTLHRRGPGKRLNAKPHGYLDVVSVRQATVENPDPRGRDYILRHVSGPDAKREVKPGERFGKRYRLDSPADAAYIFLALQRRKKKVRENVRRHRRDRH